MIRLHNHKSGETWFFQRGRDELFTRGWVGFCWVPKRWRRIKKWKMAIFLRKGCALYWRVSELLLSPKEIWHSHRMKLKLYSKVQCPEKRASSWEEGLSNYRRVSELLLKPKEEWRRIKWNLYLKVQHPRKQPFLKTKGWAHYVRMSELLLNTKDGDKE